MWEYSVHYVRRANPKGNPLDADVTPQFQQWMAQMGRDGWELVSTTPYILNGTFQGETLYFKRPMRGGTTHTN